MPNRRRFLSSTLAAAGLLTWRRSDRPHRVLEDLRVAVIGLRSRGRDHIEGFRSLPGVRVVAVSDADQEFLAREAAAFDKRGERVRVHRDYREILAADDIDAVSIATPNHWHSLMTVQACCRGKHVYVEKPVSQVVAEGRRAVDAARKYGRVVACGTQSRSNPGMRELVEWIHSGALGRVLSARGLCYKRRKSIGRVEVTPSPPRSVDLDLWCGPTPLEAPRRRNFHYDWHWSWTTGNGDVGNQGIHQMDIARWVLGEAGLAPEVVSIGARLGYVDDGETPNTQVVLHRYARAPLWFEVRGLPESAQSERMDRLHGASIGVIIECEGGRVVIDSYVGGRAFDGEGREIKSFKQGGDVHHYANFVDAVRAGRPQMLNADIREGHVSSALCHLGNLSHRSGADRSFAETAAAAGPDFAESMTRLELHLRAQGLDPSRVVLRCGAGLLIEADAETVKENAIAAALLDRTNRQGYDWPVD